MAVTTDRRGRRRDQTRRALLDAALVLFADKGLYATRVEDITERADLGKGAFYNYFESKEGLIAALVAEGIERLDREYLTDTSADPIGDLVRGHNRFFAEHPSFLLLFHQARGLLLLRPGGDSPLRAVFRDYLSRVARYCLRSGVVPSDRELHVAAVVAGTLLGTRSFQQAAGLSEEEEVATGLLTHVVPWIRLDVVSSDKSH